MRFAQSAQLGEGGLAGDLGNLQRELCVRVGLRAGAKASKRTVSLREHVLVWIA